MRDGAREEKSKSLTCEYEIYFGFNGEEGNMKVDY